MTGGFVPMGGQPASHPPLTAAELQDLQGLPFYANVAQQYNLPPQGYTWASDPSGPAPGGRNWRRRENGGVRQGRPAPAPAPGPGPGPGMARWQGGGYLGTGQPGWYQGATAPAPGPAPGWGPPSLTVVPYTPAGAASGYYGAPGPLVPDSSMYTPGTYTALPYGNPASAPPGYYQAPTAATGYPAPAPGPYQGTVAFRASPNGYSTAAAPAGYAPLSAPGVAAAPRPIRDLYNMTSGQGIRTSLLDALDRPSTAFGGLGAVTGTQGTGYSTQRAGAQDPTGWAGVPPPRGWRQVPSTRVA